MYIRHHSFIALKELQSITHSCIYLYTVRAYSIQAILKLAYTTAAALVANSRAAMRVQRRDCSHEEVNAFVEEMGMKRANLGLVVVAGSPDR